MGIFDFLSGKGGGIAKTVAAANSKHAQSADRFHALEKLRNEGSEEAIAGLLRRYTWSYDKSIEDEYEKHAVHEWLVAGATEEILPEDTEAEKAEKQEQRARIMRALESSLVHAETISWQLKILTDIANHEESWPTLEKVIAANDNEYVRDPSRKIQLIDFLGENYIDPRAAAALIQYLEDIDEPARFHTVEALFLQQNEEVAREPLLALLVSESEESRRIKIRILDGFVDAGWNTHGYKGQVEKEIAAIGRDYSLDGKGRVKKPQR